MTKARVVAVDSNAEAAFAKKEAEELRQQLGRSQASLKQLEKASLTRAASSTELIRFDGDGRCVSERDRHTYRQTDRQTDRQRETE